MPAPATRLIALGSMLACAVWRWRELSRAQSRAAGVLPALGVGIALAACAAGVAIRSDSPASRLFFWPDASGHAGAYAGAGQFLEQASAWVAAPILVLALAAALTREPRGGAMPRRNVCIASLVRCSCLFRAGNTDLYSTSLIGLARAAPSHWSRPCPVFSRKPRARAVRRARARRACCAVLACSRCAMPARTTRRDPARGDCPSVVEFTARPERALAPTRASRLIHPGLSCRAPISRRARRHLAIPRNVTGAVELARPGPRPRLRGATFFRAPSLWLRHLPEGHWRFALRLFDADGSLQGERVAAVSTLERRFTATPRTAIFWCLAGLFVLGLSPGAPWICLIVFAGLQGLWFLDLLPRSERARVFALTATERLLARDSATALFAEPAAAPIPHVARAARARRLRRYSTPRPSWSIAPPSRARVQTLLGFSRARARLYSAAFRTCSAWRAGPVAPIDALASK